MRRRLYFITLLAIVSLGSIAQNIGDAFYIYRNDGQFNAFFRDEVDSIAYSNYDLDSLYYDEIVTQLVYTSDSIYRIPLAAIDSVGFVTPETEYKSDVIKIEGELRNYVLRQDSLTIFFNNCIPSSMIPHVGDKLVTLEMSDVFPIGFAGAVSEIKNSTDKVEVVCTPVGLEDVFECYYGISEMKWDGKNLTRRYPHESRRKASGTFAPGRLTLNLKNELDFNSSYQPNDNLSFELSELRGDISVTPVVWGSSITTVIPNQGVYISLTVKGDYDLEENLSLKGGLSWKKDITLPYPYNRISWPIAPLVDFYLKPGVFIQADGEFAIQQKWTQKYRSIFHYDYSSKGEQMIENTNRVIPISSEHSGEAALKGSIGAGFFLEVGFDFIHTKKLDLANVNLRAEAGVNLVGNLVLTKSDTENGKTSTAVYEQLRDTELSLNWFYGLSGSAKFWKWGLSHDINLGNIKLNNQGNIFTCAMAPTFSDIKAQRTDVLSNVDAEANISVPAIFGGRCIQVDAGFVLKDENGNDVSSRNYSLFGYNGSQGAKEMKGKLTDIPTSEKNYKVYPHVRWMGVDLLASPSTDINMVIPVTFNDFKIGYMANIEKEFRDIDTRFIPLINLISESEQNPELRSQIMYLINKIEMDSELRDQILNNNINALYNHFDYSFKPSFTVTFDEEPEKYSDWGYAYLDNFGRENIISIKKYGTQHSETIECLRNQPKSTLTIYGYVTYANSKETVYSEPIEYELNYKDTSCPDENHPHMVDLGLPSGTKWACCNIGASKPEESGAYFAFGETDWKDEYSKDTYLHKDKDGEYEYIFLGNDISGTKYDAAYVVWGKDWRMPNYDQCQELLYGAWEKIFPNLEGEGPNRRVKYTDYYSVTKNNIPGILIVSRINGRYIFIPAAGYYAKTELRDLGVRSCCWTSSWTLSHPNDIDGHFLQDNLELSFGIDRNNPEYGEPIRPVCNK